MYVSVLRDYAINDPILDLIVDPIAFFDLIMQLRAHFTVVLSIGLDSCIRESV